MNFLFFPPHSGSLPEGALPKKSKVTTPDCPVGESKADILCGTPSLWAKPPQGEREPKTDLSR